MNLYSRRDIVKSLACIAILPGLPILDMGKLVDFTGKPVDFMGTGQKEWLLTMRVGLKRLDPNSYPHAIVGLHNDDSLTVGRVSDMEINYTVDILQGDIGEYTFDNDSQEVKCSLYGIDQRIIEVLCCFEAITDLSKEPIRVFVGPNLPIRRPVEIYATHVNKSRQDIIITMYDCAITTERLPMAGETVIDLTILPRRVPEWSGWCNMYFMEHA